MCDGDATVRATGYELSPPVCVSCRTRWDVEHPQDPPPADPSPDQTAVVLASMSMLINDPAVVEALRQLRLALLPLLTATGAMTGKAVFAQAVMLYLSTRDAPTEVQFAVAAMSGGVILGGAHAVSAIESAASALGVALHAPSAPGVN